METTAEIRRYEQKLTKDLWKKLDSEEKAREFLSLYFISQHTRGVSALQLKRMLGMKSMATTWLMLMKIRKAFADRDANYKLVFVAVEQKEWIDEKGRKKLKAGFAKVYMDDNLAETKSSVEKFITQSIKPRSIKPRSIKPRSIKPRSILKTDGKFKKIKTMKVKNDYCAWLTAPGV